MFITTNEAPNYRGKIPPQHAQQPTAPPPHDEINFASEDGLVTVITKVDSAERWPKHSYPIICLVLRPKPGTRVRPLKDGSGGVEVVLTHPETAAHINALKKADPSLGYQAPNIPAKPRWRKEFWDQKVAERFRQPRG